MELTWSVNEIQPLIVRDSVCIICFGFLLKFGLSASLSFSVPNSGYTWMYLYILIIHFSISFVCVHTFNVFLPQLCHEHDMEIKLIAIGFSRQVAEGFRSSWLQTLGSQLINRSPYIGCTNHKFYLLYYFTWKRWWVSREPSSTARFPLQLHVCISTKGKIVSEKNFIWSQGWTCKKTETRQEWENSTTLSYNGMMAASSLASNTMHLHP